MISEMYELRDRIRPAMRAKYPRGSSVCKRFANLTACLANAKDDGFLGGEAGITPEHLEREYAWLQKLAAELGV